MTFYEWLHSDERVRKYIYELATSFMDGELQTEVSDHDVKKLLRQVWQAAEAHARGESLPVPKYDDAEPPDLYSGEI